MKFPFNSHTYPELPAVVFLVSISSEVTRSVSSSYNVYSYIVMKRVKIIKD